MKKMLLVCSVLFIALVTNAQTVAGFENLTLATDTFNNGSLTGTGFSSGEGFFVNDYDTATYSGVLYTSWDGFAYTNMYGDTSLTSDTTFTNAMQYSAVTGNGFGGSGNYAIGYDAGNTKIRLTGNAKGGVVNGFYATNTTYAYLSMRHGDNFEPAFSYAATDSFVLNITGWYNGNAIADTVHFFLADFRDSTATSGILTSWQWVDLRSLGNADSLIFSFTSSQTGQFGINTPAYFAMDNFTTADMVDNYVTINYLQDTMIGVLPFFRDSAVITAPYTVSIVSGPNVAGASATVLNNNDSIWYLPSDGIVTVDTIVYAVCGANSQCAEAKVFINITGLSGINDVASGFIKTTVYPNPFSNNFKITYTGNLEQIRLYDIQGKLLQSITGSGLAGEAEVNAANLAAGAYLARIITDKGTGIARIIKQ